MESDKTAISVLGLPIPGDAANNIVIKAWQLLKQDFPFLPPVHFYLLKNIPAGAGLGAGSANGAYALTALNQKFHLDLSQQQLINYALQLGSDCPFFILNKPVLARGRGEIFESVPIDLSGCQLVIVNPGIHISTAWAFSQLTPASPLFDLRKSINKPVAEWKDFISNHFEQAVSRAHPEIADIKKQLYQSGAIFATMSGSGSTVYGLFPKDIQLNLNFPDNYFKRMIVL